MYRKKTSSWLKHWDFILLDLILLELSYLLAHWLYHGTAYYREAPLYRNVFFAIAAIDLVVGLMMGSYKGILRRGYWLETKAVAKHAIIVTVCVIAYLFAMKESSNYSRVVIFAFPIISICVLYIGRILLKKWLSKHRGPASGKRAILLIGGKKNYREIVEAFTSNPYSEFHVMGIGIIDAKENEIPNYHGFPVFCGESAIEDFAQLNWVDEALFSIPTELPLPDKMIKNFGIMGITIHIKLARVADDSSNQIVEKLEGYTVLSTSINMVSAGQLIFKRTMDICGGLVGMLLTGIIFIFVAPIIYIKSPGPIFFKQVRIGKNGKKFNIYKFRSTYMDAEERKKELMAQNDIKDGMMFKMDNDPRIIKGIGNFIRDYSLDEFPQFWNVLIGDMSLVGTRPPTVDEWEKYEMGNDLLSNAKSIRRIICPAENAYNVLDKIKNSIHKNIEKDTLIVSALGPTASILAAQLCDEGYQFVDIGHVDVEYMWFLNHAISRETNGAEADGVAVDVNSLVSMNMWGLTPDFLDVLEEGFKEFFEKEVPGNPQKAEYLIPIFIGELLEQGKMSVKVLKTNDTWYGMTYHEDVAAVKDSFKKMLENGVYKADLFADL